MLRKDLMPKGNALTLCSEDLQFDLQRIASNAAGSAEAFQRLCEKARNNLLCNHSLKKANEILAALKEIKAQKFLTAFKEKFLVFCGFYDLQKASDSGRVSYFFDPDDCAIRYNKKENSFYEKEDIFWQSLFPAITYAISAVKVEKPKKEKKEIPTQELIAYLRNRPDLPEILAALMPQEKPKPKAKAAADKLIDAI